MNMMVKMRHGFLPMLVLGATLSLGGVPQPSVVVHGLVRDPYGFPYVENVEVVMKRGTNECARFTINGLRAGGMNYSVALDMDSGGGRYASYAVQGGETVDVTVVVGGMVQPLLSTAKVVIERPGAVVRLDLYVGNDSDGDGLSDDWELELVAQSGGQLSGIEAVQPNDDFDHDGLNNRDEFLAGTFAFLRTDVLKIDSLVQTSPGNRWKLSFMTGVNTTYRIAATPQLSGGEWVPVPFALTADGPLQYQNLTGDGSRQTVYVDGAEATLFLRLVTR